MTINLRRSGHPNSPYGSTRAQFAIESSDDLLRNCEELISAFAAVQTPGLYDGRRLFAIWVRQFPIPAGGFSTSFMYPSGLPCMVVQPEGMTPTRTILQTHGGAFACKWQRLQVATAATFCHGRSHCTGCTGASRTGRISIGTRAASELASKLKSVGVSATLEVAHGIPHIGHLFASFLPEAGQAIKHIAVCFPTCTARMTWQH